MIVMKRVENDVQLPSKLVTFFIYYHYNNTTIMQNFNYKIIILIITISSYNLIIHYKINNSNPQFAVMVRVFLPFLVLDFVWILSTFSFLTFKQEKKNLKSHLRVTGHKFKDFFHMHPTISTKRILIPKTTKQQYYQQQTHDSLIYISAVMKLCSYVNAIMLFSRASLN